MATKKAAIFLVVPMVLSACGSAPERGPTPSGQLTWYPEINENGVKAETAFWKCKKQAYTVSASGRSGYLKSCMHEQGFYAK